MKKTALFDMHGIVYLYSADLKASSSTKAFDSRLKSYSEEAFKDFKAGKDAAALKWEREAVKKGYKGDPKGLQIYEIPGAINCMKKYIDDGYRIITVSSGDKATVRRILMESFRKNKIDESLMKSITSVLAHGKGNPEFWKCAFKKYPGVTDVYEDEHPDAVEKAAKELGLSIRVHPSVKS